MATLREIFSRIGRVKPAEVLPEHEAFFTILAAAAMCDQRMSVEEQQELQALSQRLKIFVELPTAQTNAMFEKVFVSLKADFKAAYRSALKGLTDQMGQAAFVHALDIISADREVNEAEEDFLNELASHLDLAPSFKEKAAEVIAIKNSI